MEKEKPWTLFPYFLVGPFIWECIAYAIMLTGIAIPGSFALDGSIPTIAVFCGFVLLCVGAFIWVMARAATGSSAVAQVFERIGINRDIRKRNS